MENFAEYDGASSPPWTSRWQQQPQQQQHRRPPPPPPQQQQRGQQHQQQRQTPGNYYYPFNPNYNTGYGSNVNNNNNNNNNNNPAYGDQYTTDNNDAAAAAAAAADPNSYQSLLLELDESTIREMTLSHHVQNLSSLVSSLTSETEYLSGRIEALSERLADSESNYHTSRNRNLELEANCTALSSTIVGLKREAENLADSARRAEERDGERERSASGLRAELRRATDDLERLACLVETERFEEERARFLDDLDEKRIRERKRKKKKKKRSFWGWFFGWGDSSSSSSSSSSFESDDDYEDGALTSSIVADATVLAMDDEERKRAARELARTTLLHALQAERNNVDELESALEALRRNNTAIMDVVSSRDTIVSELNDRVAVFEEDRMVLKAALRQLQAEMREEAPRTERLARDLEEAREREITLIEEMESMAEDMRLEREDLEARLTNATREHNRTREELDLIGLYVDQLEDRLANFAIARRDLDVREKECGRLEQCAREQAEMTDEYRRRVDELSREQNETRAMLEGLAVERDGSRARTEALESEVADWKARVDDAERRTEEMKGQSARQLFLRLEEEKAAWEGLSRRRIEEERIAWDEEKAKELELTLANEKAAWEAHIAEEWEVRSNDVKSEVERGMITEWTDRLRRERAELESRYLEDMQRAMEEKRFMWEEAKAVEINDRITTARSLWEKEADDRRVVEDERRAASYDSSSFEDEVEMAAAKVYARLEERGVSFGVSSPSLGPLQDLFGGDAVDEVNSQVVVVDTSESYECDESDDDPDDVDEKNEREEPAMAIEEDTTESSSDISGQVVRSMPQPAKKDSTSRPAVNSRPPKCNNTNPRSVPFRSVRKAFSRATGLHGLLTPSSLQLHQRREILGRRQTQRRQWKPPTTNDTAVETHLLRYESDGGDISVEGVATDELQPSSSPLSPLVMDEELIESSAALDDPWESYSYDNTDRNDASSWPSSDSMAMKDMLEPPPLPELD